MEILQRFGDPVLGKGMLAAVTALARKASHALNRAPVIMEVCGTHTAAFSRSGIRELLDDSLDLRSGPGCPVCVTGKAEIDCMIELSRLPRTVIGTFGDMVRVPGSNSSLEKESSRGASVKIFYSPVDAVDYAATHPQRELVFIGAGFETTAPAVALSLAGARKRGLSNYSVYSIHKVLPPVMHRLAEDPDSGLDGFILPGHLCTVTGSAPFEFIAHKYGLPAVVTGFETLDLLSALYELLKMIVTRKPRVVNGYARVVRNGGNGRAKAVTDTYFKKSSAYWRGFGDIAGSGLKIRGSFSDFDAVSRFNIRESYNNAEEEEECSCGDLLRGKIKPPRCNLFGDLCTPEHPVGPCMVSAEGACAVFYRHEKRRVTV